MAISVATRVHVTLTMHVGGFACMHGDMLALWEVFEFQLFQALHPAFWK